MQRWNIKPSKPLAVLSLLVGVGLLVVGVTRMHKFTPFVGFWVIFLIAIVGFNLWSAFSSRGSTYTVQSRADDNAGHRR